MGKSHYINIQKLKREGATMKQDQGIQPIDKTKIFITYDDASRMIDFCKDEQGNITREFFDWYLDAKGMFFEKVGTVILDLQRENLTKFALNFDFSDPDIVMFELFPYLGKYAICRFIFYRQDNISMTDVSFKITYFNQRIYQECGHILVPIDTSEKLKKITSVLSKVQKGKSIKEKSFMNEVKLIKSSTAEIFKEIINTNCKMFIYFAYSLMYYASKIKPEEISIAKSTKKSTDGEIVNVKYKYNGYVDLKDNGKIYRPVINRQPDDPIREYQRHIEKWAVRGHYRRTSTGLIWIEPHLKGTGNLENRVYSTLDEKDLSLTSKVFAVKRIVRTGTSINNRMNENEVKLPDSNEVVKQTGFQVNMQRKSTFQLFLKIKVALKKFLFGSFEKTS